uniref:Uncharacterized protein n=1 Tax=Nothobranchius furzeri TaxID=105023 RepID=A0A8C6LEQ4_NOTFU
MCYCLFGPLGTLQIMVGLINIGLGPGRMHRYPDDLMDLSAAYWLGAMFIMVGMVSVIPSCWRNHGTLIFSVIMNVVGFIFAFIACVLYHIDQSNSSLPWRCDATDPKNCPNVAHIAQRMLIDMDITLIVMAGLQLISSLILVISGIMLLRSGRMEKDVSDVEIWQPLLKNTLLSGSAA